MLDLMVIVNLCGDTYKVAMILGSKSRYISDTSSVTMDLYESLLHLLNILPITKMI